MVLRFGVDQMSNTTSFSLEGFSRSFGVPTRACLDKVRPLLQWAPELLAVHHLCWGHSALHRILWGQITLKKIPDQLPLSRSAAASRIHLSLPPWQVGEYLALSIAMSLLVLQVPSASLSSSSLCQTLCLMIPNSRVTYQALWVVFWKFPISLGLRKKENTPSFPYALIIAQKKEHWYGIQELFKLLSGFWY